MISSLPPLIAYSKTFGQVGPGAEELHLLAQQHGRDTTGNGAVVSPGSAHDFVAFELNGAGVDGYLGGKAPETVTGKRGEYQMVRFGSGAGPRL